MQGEDESLSARSDAWLLQVHQHAVAQYQASREIVSRNNIHEDGMIIWLIGLAGGAIYLALQVISNFSPSISFGFFLFSVAPWGMSALCGIVTRMKLAEGILEEDKVFLVRGQELTGLPLKNDLTHQQKAVFIVNFFKPVKDWPADETRKMQENLEKIAKSATGWGSGCKILLGVGVVWCPLFLWLVQRCE